jgi:HAD superfamily hydrolase (TIGR01509 family)
MRVFPGVKTVIPALAERVPLAIASGALRHEIREILSSIGLVERFRTIVSAEDVRQGKPDPEIFLKALANLNAELAGNSPISASDCLVIEDSKEGIRGARSAGMKCLAVTNSHPADLLKGADAVVESLEPLTLKALEALWS